MVVAGIDDCFVERVDDRSVLNEVFDDLVDEFVAQIFGNVRGHLLLIDAFD
jgi:hypothetical protein